MRALGSRAWLSWAEPLQADYFGGGRGRGIGTSRKGVEIILIVIRIIVISVIVISIIVISIIVISIIVISIITIYEVYY